MNRDSDKLPRPARGRGFTLIELMVSIALVLILILGINQVFKIASDTVNAGQALSGADRENRGIQGTLTPDVQNMVLTDAPFFIIRSRVQPAFRSRTDEQADRDGNPYTVDIDGNNQEGDPGIAGERIAAATYNSRNHRLDKLQFFANYLYRRQTGAAATGELISNFSTNEAYICYAHLKVGKNNPAVPADYYLPGDPDNANTNNRYATDWILGRNVILLTEGQVPGQFRQAQQPPKPLGDGTLSPLTENAKSDDGKFFFPSSVYDVAQTSIANFRAIVGNPQNWGSGEPWWQTISGFRFYGYPYPTRPLNAASMARTVPIFLRGCTQFIVEYAGDYLNQGPAATNLNGDITGSAFGPTPSTDGIVDYIVLPNGARRTRWYGLPRNVDTSDDDRRTGVPMIHGTGVARQMIDVVPLRDVLKSVGVTVDPVDFIERDIDKRLPVQANYAAVSGGPRGATGFVNPMAGTDKTEYVAAWGPSGSGSQLSKGAGISLKPRMIRITLVVDDPAGRMSEGQTYEYVFTLP